MSIEDDLSALEAQGEIHRFMPRFDPGESEQRRIYLTTPLRNWIDRNVSRESEIRYKMAVHAHLGWFVKGKPVDNTDFMKRLQPLHDEVWEFRIYFATRATRIACRFARPDCVLATNWRPRAELGHGTSTQWAQFKQRAIGEWERLLPGRRPFVGRNFLDYVTLNGEDRHA